MWKAQVPLSEKKNFTYYHLQSVLEQGSLRVATCTYSLTVCFMKYFNAKWYYWCHPMSISKELKICHFANQKEIIGNYTCCQQLIEIQFLYIV